MRWEGFFEDLHSQYEAGERLDHDDAVAELVEGEQGQVRLADRVRARVGEPVTVRLRDGQDVAGAVLDAAPQWLLVAQGERRTLVPAAAVTMVRPLGVSAPPAGGVERRLRVTHALRALARTGTRVRVRCDGGEVVGQILRVGADHLDVRTDLAGTTTPVVTVALASVLAVHTL